MKPTTRLTRQFILAAAMFLGAAVIWSVVVPTRRHAAPAAAVITGIVVTEGLHDVLTSLRDVDHARGAIEREGRRERGEGVGNSEENESELSPVAFESVPDGGTVEQTSYGPRAALLPVASFNSGLNGALDNNIGVGPNNLVAMINSRFKVMTKTGATTFGPVNNNSIFSGFAGGVCANSGDGHIQYDQLAHRWLFTQPNFSSGYWICYAVSTTDDPTGPYYRYAFSRPLFPDYPRVAVWPDGYYTTTSTGDNVIQKTACVVDRTKMLAGLPATQQCFTINNVSFMEPANVDGQVLPLAGAPALLFAAGGSQLNSVLQDDGIYVYKFHVDWATPANSTLTGPRKIVVSPYSFLCGGQLVSCVPQPGSTTRLDAQGDKIMHRAAYRNVDGIESIVLQHSINTEIGGGGPRWYEFRLDGNGEPQLYQQSTYAPDARYRWMGSIGMDRKGNIGMGFSYGGGPYTLPMTSSSCVPPACDRVGVRFTARQAGDPLGMMTYADGVIAAGVSSSTGGSNRWEDWSVLAIDPTDDCTFWYNGGYMPAGATTYNGRIGAWRLPNCRLDAVGAASTPLPNGQISGPVAAFTDSDLTATAGVFTASVDWGDGSSSAGTITGGAGSFSVAGSHTYAGSGWHTITTTITGSEGSTASATSSVLVEGGLPTVELTFASAPAGLQLSFNGSLGTAPFSRTVIVGSTNSVSVASPQGNYQFGSWSDGGAQSHNITAPATATVYTAAFTVPPPAPNIQIANSRSALSNASGTFIDLAYTVPNLTGQNLLLVVFGGAEAQVSNATLPLSATFNGRTLTQAGAIRTPATGQNNGSGIFWSPVQPNEAGTIRLTFTGTCLERGIGALILAGANAAGPFAVETTTGSTSLSDTIVTTTPNAMVISAAAQGNNSALTATGTGHLRDVDVALTSSRVAGGHVEVAVPAARTLGYSGTINRIAMVLAAFPAGASAPDTTAPVVSISAPAAGVIAGAVGVTASASDNVGIQSVRFQRDGVDLGAADTSAPYQISWDTTAVGNGPYCTDCDRKGRRPATRRPRTQSR